MSTIAQRIKSAIVRRTKRYVARNRRASLVRAVARLCRRYLDSYENANFDSYSNGERWVLEQLRSGEEHVIFDVGANSGAWTRMARNSFRQAHIHCFEISPLTFDSLRRSTEQDSRIHANCFGLSDSVGAVEVLHHSGNTELTSLLEFGHSGPKERVTSSVTTGDAYIETRGISSVHFLKIDVEGAEPMVLNGLEKSFENNRIDIVQLEYGQINILSHFLLRDIHEFFKARGFVVGKIFPNYVEFRDYEYQHEDFAGCNFLAVQSDRTDILKRLQGQ